MTERVLDRRIPTDWEHVEKYPLLMTSSVSTVEEVLPLPGYKRKYDQGKEGACVGFGSSWMKSIMERRFFDAVWLYKEAQKVDEWEGEDYDGTSVRAAMDVLRKVGHKTKYNYRIPSVPKADYGITANRWATTVDEMRTSIAAGIPVVMGTNWYEGFDTPQPKGREFWVPSQNIGRVRGGHAWCIYGASDKRQAFKMVNSWGDDYPLTWFPYELVERLLKEYGEATLVTNR